MEKNVKLFYQQKGVQADPFSFVKVTEDNVLQKLKALSPSKASGHDNIPSRFLPDATEVITPCVTHIINLSTEQRKFRHDFKLTRVTPLYKKGSKSDLGNYRPVSILSSLSKVMDKVIHEQLVSNLSSHNLLYDFSLGSWNLTLQIPAYST